MVDEEGFCTVVVVLPEVPAVLPPELEPEPELVLEVEPEDDMFGCCGVGCGALVGWSEVVCLLMLACS